MIIDDLLIALGGLSLFLIGLNSLKKCFYELSNTKVKDFITRFTKSNFRAFIVGIITTILVQSSASVTAIVITLISCDFISLTRGLLIIIGANVGTCFNAYLFTFNIANYSFIIIFIGVILSFFKHKKIQTLSNFTISIGLIFTGLNFLEDGMAIISTTPFFNETLLHLTSNDFTCLLSSTLLTALIQSSSIIIVLTQELYFLKSIPLSSTIIIMLGANIGTCLTGIIASINNNKTSKQAAWANVIFNVLGAIIFMIFLYPYTSLLQIIEDNYFLANPRLSVTTAHTIFNIISALLGFIFINQLVKLVTFKFKKE